MKLIQFIGNRNMEGCYVFALSHMMTDGGYETHFNITFEEPDWFPGSGYTIELKDL